MSRPTIAVVVPNRNDTRFLPRTLRSILDQAEPPDELIVVDDQSTDDSVEVARSAIRGHPFAQLVVNPVNLGTNGAMNIGLQRVNSEYVLFLASNDLVLPGIFARARSCFVQAPQAALWSAMSWLVDEEDRVIRLHPSAVVALRDAWLSPERCVKLAYRFGNWFTGSTLIYHRGRLLAAGGIEMSYGAPADLIIALTLASLHGALYSPVPYAAIRVHGGSYSSRALKDVTGLETMYNRLRERGPAASPRLFTERFINRIAARYRFAAVRALRGELASVARHTTGGQRRILEMGERNIPRSWSRTRIAFAFFLLRPFDIVPTLIQRLLVWLVIRVRSRFPREGRAGD